MHLAIGALYRPAGHFSVFFYVPCAVTGTNTTVTNHCEYMMWCTVEVGWYLCDSDELRRLLDGCAGLFCVQLYGSKN